MSYKILFSKMHANGNDFMILDNRHEKQHLPDPMIIRCWANRNTGVGFDQLLWLSQPPLEQQADLVCRIFNADGTEANQCGHGMACVGRYVHMQQNDINYPLRIATSGGIRSVDQAHDDRIKVELGCPMYNPESIPFVTKVPGPVYPIFLKVEHKDEPDYLELLQFQQHQLKLLKSVKTSSMQGQCLIWISALSLGNPHCVVLVPDVDNLPLNLGFSLSQHACFPDGANVEFMQIIRADLVKLRTYERGVGENQACGSGACAAVVIGHDLGFLNKKVDVQFRNGNRVQVSWNQEKSSVCLKTAVQYVFQGEIVLQDPMV